MLAKKHLVTAVLLLLPCIILAQTPERLPSGDFLFDGYGTGAGRTATIIDYTGQGGSVTIGDRFVGQYQVTRIAEGALRGKNISGITFPSGLVFIGANALADNRLATVTISGRIREISAGAFRNNQISSLTIQSGVDSIGEGAFQQNRLTDITLPATITLIEDSAFAGNSITRVAIGANAEVEDNAIANNFAAFYRSNNRATGVYLYRDGGWYTEQGWRAEEQRRRQQPSPTPPPQQPQQPAQSSNDADIEDIFIYVGVGFYAHGITPNLTLVGANFFLGCIFDVSDNFAISLMADTSLGLLVVYPSLIEWSTTIMSELFFGDHFGIGLGFGIYILGHTEALEPSANVYRDIFYPGYFRLSLFLRDMFNIPEWERVKIGAYVNFNFLDPNETYYDPIGVGIFLHMYLSDYI